MTAQLALRYRNGRLKNLRPFKLDADGVPVDLSRLAGKFKPPGKLLPPLPRPLPAEARAPVMVSKRRPQRRK